MVEPADNLQSLADRLLVQKITPPAVLTNDKGDILYLSGKTSKYLEPTAGKTNWNIFAMARTGLRVELEVAFRKAIRQKEAIIVKGLKIGTNGNTRIVDITVKAIGEPETLRGTMMVVFTDVATPLGKKESDRSKIVPYNQVKVLELEQEFDQVCEELQATRQAMQSAQEKLTTVNDELQSTGEELTIFKDKMQSLCEENTRLKGLLDNTEGFVNK
ncbi:MAG: hypothetical protein A2511_01525 [Deltaproteobacteria bacterium RIFOXYD12_FULL_50_9]|nr:MAG: hypothetical protein A2511_01525 [Deltaproteobacteria bacterium RIFOXYD12_FULL_50_9]